MVECDGRAARNDGAAFFYHLAKVVFVVRSVSGEGDRYQGVLLVIADEIEYEREIFGWVFSQASSELLYEYNGRFSFAQHDDLVERRNVDALVENIHREDVLQFAIFEFGDSRVALVVGGFSAYGEGARGSFVGEARKGLCLVGSATEDKPSAVFFANRILFDLSDDMVNALFRRQA